MKNKEEIIFDLKNLFEKLGDNFDYLSEDLSVMEGYIPYKEIADYILKELKGQK